MSKKIKVYAGYLHLKPINGVIFPSYIQNQMNKNYINEKLFRCNSLKIKERNKH